MTTLVDPDVLCQVLRELPHDFLRYVLPIILFGWGLNRLLFGFLDQLNIKFSKTVRRKCLPYSIGFILLLVVIVMGFS